MVSISIFLCLLIDIFRDYILFMVALVVFQHYFFWFLFSLFLWDMWIWLSKCGVIVLILNHQRVVGTIGSGNPDLLAINVKNKIMLTHQGTTKHDLVVIALISSQTILGPLFVKVEVFWWVPVNSTDLAFNCLHMNIDSWVPHKKFLYTVFELFFVEIETSNLFRIWAKAKMKFARAVFFWLSVLVVVFICSITEMFEVINYAIVKFVWEITKCSSRIYESNWEFVTATKRMSVHSYSQNVELVVVWMVHGVHF